MAKLAIALWVGSVLIYSALFVSGYVEKKATSQLVRICDKMPNGLLYNCRWLEVSGAR